MYFPDRGCVHTLLTLYVYATATSQLDFLVQAIVASKYCMLSQFRGIFSLKNY